MKKLILLTSIFLTSMLCFAKGQDFAVYNLTLTDADTEYSITIPETQTAEAITIQCRTAYDIRIASATGVVATPTVSDPLIGYWTVKSSSFYYDDVNATGKTFYFASSQAGVVVEILIWLN